jgi:hypothetical protein
MSEAAHYQEDARKIYAEVLSARLDYLANPTTYQKYYIEIMQNHAARLYAEARESMESKRNG